MITTRTISVASTETETIAVYNGHKVGAVWGPAVEGDWFAIRVGQDPVRVATRTEADAHLLPLLTEPLPASFEVPATECGCFAEVIGGGRIREVPCPTHGGSVLVPAASSSSDTPKEPS